MVSGDPNSKQQKAGKGKTKKELKEIQNWGQTQKPPRTKWGQRGHTRTRTGTRVNQHDGQERTKVTVWWGWANNTSWLSLGKVDIMLSVKYMTFIGANHSWTLLSRRTQTPVSWMKGFLTDLSTPNSTLLGLSQKPICFPKNLTGKIGVSPARKIGLWHMCHTQSERLKLCELHTDWRGWAASQSWILSAPRPMDICHSTTFLCVRVDWILYSHLTKIWRQR